MKEVIVSDIYNVTQISKSNDSAWIEIQKAIEHIEGDVLLDFDEVNLIDPFNNDQFMKMMANPRIHIRIYDEELAATLKIALRLGGIEEGNKIDLVEFEDDYDAKAEERNKEVKLLADRISSVAEESNNVLTINLGNTIEQVSSSKTLDALEKLIRDTVELNESIGTVEINLTDVVVQRNVLEDLAKFQNRLEGTDILVSFQSEDLDMINKINIASLNIELTTQERIDIIKGCLDEDGIVIVQKFKRRGKNEDICETYNADPLIGRVAIYRGIVDNEIVLDTFNNDYFFTKLDYSLDRDGESHPGLRVDKWRISVDKTGVYDHFLGSRHHISAPVKLADDSDLKVINKVVGDSITSYEVTLPEFIKIVLDDFGVDYNQQSLQKYIEESRG